MEKRALTNYLLIILSLEKIFQHVIVSLSLLYDIGSIRSTVALDYRVLMVSGVVDAILFAVALLALIQKKRWGLYLMALLAASDIIGEFIAQGTVLVAINVSILVAIVLLFLCYFERRNLHKTEYRRIDLCVSLTRRTVWDLNPLTRGDVTRAIPSFSFCN
jgi:uncharacterized membrane protein (UPF0136 family)